MDVSRKREMRPDDGRGKDDQDGVAGSGVMHPDDGRMSASGGHRTHLWTTPIDPEPLKTPAAPKKPKKTVQKWWTSGSSRDGRRQDIQDPVSGRAICERALKWRGPKEIWCGYRSVVDEQASFVDVKGSVVDIKGSVVDGQPSGVPLLRDGKRFGLTDVVDDDGMMVDDDGMMVDDDGMMVDDEDMTSLVDEQHRMVDDEAMMVDDEAMMVDKQSLVVDEQLYMRRNL
ncbi:hypothetical protein BDZ89DRAFT_1117747 [Hymenopellis radicata]|nr:hypothetical protein BDZ89DRAFT_1117747 [Hymenopellis radicata]